MLICARQLAVALAIALLCLAALPHAAVVEAATFVVNSTADLPDDNPGDGVCHTTANTCTLRAAIQQANALGSSNAITLPAGTYKLTIPPSGSNDVTTGDLNVTSSITLTGAGAATTIVDGNGLDRVFSVQGGTVNISGITVQHGSATTGLGFGGGLYVAGQNVTLNLANAVVANNQATTNLAQGGGLLVQSGATLNVSNSTFRNNSATNGGGGLRIFFDATVSVTGSTFSDNQVAGLGANGGGLEIQGPTTLTNVTVSGNSTGGEGGGVSVESGTTTLVNVTIAGNSSNSGSAGNLDMFGTSGGGGETVNIRNTIVANPAAGSNCRVGGLVTLHSGGANLDSENTCGFSPALGDLVNVNPKLGPLASNGGPTQTQALLIGSPAIDAVQSGCPPPTTDQRGTSRPQGPRCDSGAYEALPVCQPRPNVGVSVTPAGSGRLQATLTATSNTSTPTNTLQTVQLTSATGALVRDANDNPIVVPTTINLPANTTTYTFYIRKAAANQAATVFLAVTDACGPWQTFVGGGPTAFPPEPPPAAPTPTPTALTALPFPTSSTVAAATGPGGGAMPSGQGAPAAQPPATAPAAPMTAPPTPAPICAPRPAVQVATAPDGAGRLRVTLTADPTAHAPLRALRLGAATNALVDVGEQTGLSGNTTVALPAGTQQAQLVIRRATAGQASTVPLTVVDACGEWPTVLGGRPGAF